MKKKVVAFVPIKLNSQRLPNKNILPLGDFPLSHYIFKTLLKVSGIDEVYVYCSDEKIKKYIPTEVRFLKRSEDLDGEFVKGLDIYQSFTDEVEADVYILAHTTAPFIKASSIESALNYVVNGEYDSAFSAQKIQSFAWYDNKPFNYELTDTPRTQDLTPIFIETSAFFIFENSIMKEYERRIGFNPYLQEVDTVEAVDIDTKEDYEFAQLINTSLKGRKNNV